MPEFEGHSSDGTAAPRLERQNTKQAWRAWLVVLVVAGLLLLPLLHKGASATGPGGPGGANKAGAGVAVTATKVQLGTMDIYLDAIGTVTPLATVNVYSQVSGRVMSVNYREGQFVQKGDLLAQIDPRPSQAQLQQLQGTLAKDRASLQQAQVDLSRYQSALQDHAIAQQTVFDEEATVRQGEGTVQADEAQVQYYEVQLNYCRIVAPISGRIGLRLVDAGNTIFSGSSSTIATIAQINPTTVVFSIAEDHLAQVEQQLKTGGAAGLGVLAFDRSQTTQLAAGRLLTLDNQVDTTTGTVKYRAQFGNATGTLFPNQFVNARLQVNTLHDAKLVPTSAVQYNGQQAFVYLVHANGTVAIRKITVLNTEGERSAIDGLVLGDDIVTSNFDRITDGGQVTVAGAGPAR